MITRAPLRGSRECYGPGKMAGSGQEELGEHSHRQQRWEWGSLNPEKKVLDRIWISVSKTYPSSPEQGEDASLAV